MQDLTIAAIQMNAPLGRVEHNLKANVRLAKPARVVPVFRFPFSPFQRSLSHDRT